MHHRKFFLTALLAALALLPAKASYAAGMWNGQDLFHVPISWCVIEGSPAAVAPNIDGDTTTDAVIWRRHERPTDIIHTPQAGISFRSAINEIWGTLSFPIIADPDQTFGVQGDMRGEDVNAAADEFNQMQNDCDTAWDNLGRAGIGITAVNANLFHDGTGAYVGTIGWGGCVQNTLAPGVCVTPFDGLITVIDNHYLFPTVPDRTFPDGSGNQFVVTDRVDQLAGHELSHALSLPHRNSLTALMNPMQRDNDGNGEADNIGLNNTEVTALRTAAQIVNGLEIDPPNVFLPGRFIAVTRPDAKRDPKLPGYLDLAAVKATLDTQNATFGLSQRLFGLVPQGAALQRHWFLVDADGPQRGATAAQLKQLGVPETDFLGADLLIRADVKGPQITGGAAWKFVDGPPQVITGSVKLDLLAMVLHPHFAALKKPGPKLVDKGDYPIHHLVSVSLPSQLFGIGAGHTLNVHALVADATGKAVDRLDPRETGRGTPVTLDFPSFPHCYPQGAGTPGGTVKVDFDGLKPNRGFHALLGAQMAGRGVTDSNGNGTVDLTIPKDTVAGPHLVTIGNDLTALTADCTVTLGGTAK